MKTIVGITVFLCIWMGLGVIAESYIFPDLYAAYPKQFTWVCCWGALMYIIATEGEEIAKLFFKD